MTWMSHYASIPVGIKYILFVYNDKQNNQMLHRYVKEVLLFSAHMTNRGNMGVRREFTNCEQLKLHWFLLYL
jgi:hypothetical protein